MGTIRDFSALIVSQGDYFESGRESIIARAPGRLDVMGGIADYSGSLVLELPLADATFVAAQRSDSPVLSVRSSHESDTVSVPLSSLEQWDYVAARAALATDSSRRWAAYVAGALVVLHRELGVSLDRGVRIFIDSTVPPGKGVASSAALEVAAMQAIASAYDMELDGPALATLCQMVENRVVGAPCGIMDQMTSACGEENRLLALLCQPAEILGQIPLPGSLELWGIDSGIRHEVGDSDYGDVRIGAFMGYRILADHRGLAVTPVAPGRVTVEDPRWHGYLANITPEEWDRQLRHHVPPSMSGEEFLHRYQGTTDAVTRVDPARTYAIRLPTEHPIRENARVSEFKRLLEGGADSEAVRLRLGALMYESHASYGACGLGSSGTDRLVEMAHAAGATQGIYGAKITGGGSGGVVAVLARSGSRASIDDIANRYAVETGRVANVLGGSSNGAKAYGDMRRFSKARPV